MSVKLFSNLAFIQKKLSIYFFVVYFIIFSSFVYGDQQQKSMEITNLIDNFEAISAKIIACCNAPGAAVAIVTPKEILSLKTYGVRHLGKKEYVNQDTLFRVASLSKIFTSALVSKLNTANIIDLESPIKQYLPFIHISDHNHINRIKIKNLLSHTSGIAAYSLESKAYLPISLNELIADLPTTRKVSEPGKMFHYQNVIFSLIAPIISNATKCSFTENLKKELLDPLGIVRYSLTDASYAENDNRAYPHLRKNFSIHTIYRGRSYYDNILPAAGMSFSIKEMAKLLQSFMGGYPSVLDNKTLESVFLPKIFVNHGLSFCKKKRCVCKKYMMEHYGLGCRIISFKINTKCYIYHLGHVKGFMSGFRFSPENKIGIVVLTNSDNSPLPSLLMEYFFKVIDGSSVSDLNKLLDRWKNKLNKKRMLV